MFDNFSQWWHGWFWGMVSFPVSYYVIKNFGAVILEHLKKGAQKVTNKIKGK